MLRCPVVMKAILLAGGKGTRLRPLTLHTPKPIVPIFDRPFLQYQIDLLRQVPEIDEIVLSLNYQPRRIEEVFGDGSDLGIRPPLRRRAAAARHRRRDQVRGRRRARTSRSSCSTATSSRPWTCRRCSRCTASASAKATIVLTPVDNPVGLRPGRDRRATATCERSSRSPSPTRSAATRSTPASTCSSPRRSTRIPADTRVFDRARLLPVARRRTARRSSPTSTAATGSTSARPRSTGRRTATSWTAASWRRRSRGAPAPRCVSPERADRRRRDHRGALLHRRRRGRQGRRAHRPVLASSAGTATSARTRRRRRRHPLAEHLGRQRGAHRRRSSPAGTATSAATSRSATARCSATSRSSPTTQARA